MASLVCMRFSRIVARGTASQFADHDTPSGEEEGKLFHPGLAHPQRDSRKASKYSNCDPAQKRFTRNVGRPRNRRTWDAKRDLSVGDLAYSCVPWCAIAGKTETRETHITEYSRTKRSAKGPQVGGASRNSRGRSALAVQLGRLRSPLHLHLSRLLRQA